MTFKPAAQTNTCTTEQTVKKRLSIIFICCFSALCSKQKQKIWMNETASSHINNVNISAKIWLMISTCHLKNENQWAKRTINVNVTDAVVSFFGWSNNEMQQSGVDCKFATIIKSNGKQRDDKHKHLWVCVCYSVTPFGLPRSTTKDRYYWREILRHTKKKSTTATTTVIRVRLLQFSSV